MTTSPPKTPAAFDGKAILDLPMDENDADAATVRDYLRALLFVLWEEGEGFSGKRPFGNSGWERELRGPLVKAGLVAKNADYWDSKNTITGAIRAAIAAL